MKTGIKRSLSLKFYLTKARILTEFYKMMNESSPKCLYSFLNVEGISQNNFPIVALCLNAVVVLCPPQSSPQ